uniref:Osteoclast-stimulating factor 1 n=1 Tax=Romanomermis culicivorax TaxID=13658 RepID=A0A915K9Q8_ROMCU
MIPPKPISRPDRILVYRALYNYTAGQPDELSFNEGDLLYISDATDSSGWWTGRCNGKSGLIPSNYVTENTECINFPLHEAAKRGNEAFLQECLENHVSVNSLDKSGSTPLYWAAHGGHLPCLKLILNFKPDLDAKNKLGDTALHAAAWKDHCLCVAVLIEAGVNLNIKNIDGKTALDMATDPEVASILKRAASDKASSKNDEYEIDSNSESD